MKKIFDYFIRFFGAFLAVLLVNLYMTLCFVENVYIRWIVGSVVAFLALQLADWEKRNPRRIE